MKQDLTKGSAFPVILRFTIPIIGGNLFQLFYTLADTVIVGRTLGADALAAVGSTGTVIYFILCFIQGFTGGLGVILGQRFGARDGEGMRRSIAVSLVLCVLSTVLITGIVCPLSHQILSWMNTPDQIRDMAYDYMLVVLLGTGATIYYNMISNILRAMGDSRTPALLPAVFLHPQHCAGSSFHPSASNGRGRSRLGHRHFPTARGGTVQPGRVYPF